jgi:hypothetical protein
MPTKIHRIDQLQPYRSLLLARIQDSATVTRLIGDCLDDIEKILKLKIESEAGDDDRERVKVSRKNPEGTTRDGLDNGFIHYKLRKPVSWTESNEIYDVENHLVLLTRKTNTGFLAVYQSENSRRRKIRNSFSSPSYEGLQHLMRVDPDRLNSAFFGDAVRTLWLSGMHRRVPVKADAKILSGQDLKYALDPLNDQTFYFTAARSQSDALGTVGISPMKSRVWTRRSGSWEEYRKGVSRILDRLGDNETADEEHHPLPVLADLAKQKTDLGTPYDVVLQPPELLTSDVNRENEGQQILEEWAYNTYFDVSEDSDSPNVEATLYHRDDEIGSIKIELNISDPTDIEVENIEITPDPEEVEDEEKKRLLKEIESLCSRTGLLKIYYDSGHTLSGGSLYSVRFQDRPFKQFIWASFDDEYDVTKEKPSDFPGDKDTVQWDEPTGAQDKDGDEVNRSLFHWVYKNWPPDVDCWDQSKPPNNWEERDDSQGWLAIDDGAMEIADFIHYDPDPDSPVISLIHVKGAGSNSNGRQISVANYEVVAGQAVKNLRRLENTTLAAALRKGADTKVGSFVWEDGELVEVEDEGDEEKSRRDEMADAIEDQDTDVERRVVIIQPHVRNSYYENVRDGSGGQNQTRLWQLDALLNGARQSCNGLGAKFWVIAADA